MPLSLSSATCAERFSKTLIESVLNKKELTFKMEKIDGDEVYYLNLNNQKATLRALGQGATLWLYADLEPAVDVETINAWNRDKLRSRAVRTTAFKDDKDVPVSRLEWDLDARLASRTRASVISWC